MSDCDDLRNNYIAVLADRDALRNALKDAASVILQKCDCPASEHECLPHSVLEALPYLRNLSKDKPETSLETCQCGQRDCAWCAPEEHTDDCQGGHCVRCGSCDPFCVCYAR